ncbi:MAG: phosphoribosylformylglycinamidine synthase [Candidatus Latescibacteria bacterium]|nr:phosphoribosylformylglycinamidine synthase [Candidatus Latescibacterota bacterium]
MSLLHFFRTPALSPAQKQTILQTAQQTVSSKIRDIETEYCFNIQADTPLSTDQQDHLAWLLRETFEAKAFSDQSFLKNTGTVLEVGPRMNFSTAWSTNATSICHACGLTQISRVERSRRYLITGDLNPAEQEAFIAMVHDRMTECPYPEPLTTFETGVAPEPTYEIPLIEEGRAALERINREMGLAFDDWDLDYYTDLFLDQIKRNPTNVECFDIAQSNSEHCRHWFFRGRLVIDGQEMPDHLIAMVQKPLKANPNNSTIAFKDNSSALRGYPIQTILPAQPGKPGPFALQNRDYDIIFTAETHNFPSGVAPFPGAETGTGGRIRDVQATGRGALVVAGTSAYCVGNLYIPGYNLPWEDPSFKYPENLATPLQIEIDASNGASDYGNKFGEPMIQGYTRSFGMRLSSGERREYIKPIMFSAGIGQMDARHTEKEKPKPKMLVTKIGGPAYRIGMGGGAASSMVQGENEAELDFNAVQRGDAEMEQKLNRVIRACVELGDKNPVVSIHDQGAGGNCNVLKEIVEPEGARIDIRSAIVGDNTLSVLEVWGAEFQENSALLVRPEHADLFDALCKREKMLYAFMGEVTGDGKVVVYDSETDTTPVDLDLDKVLGDMPQKTFTFDRFPIKTEALSLPENLTVSEALDRVLRLVSVGSKRFLTNKVDRSVTGLIAQQQCVGPLQLPAADVAVIAQSHFSNTGAATAIGEQPIKGLIDPAAMARLCVGEMLTNITWASISAVEDIKCSGNWMWAAKLPGEGAALYDAAEALVDILLDLGVAIDGGKDSLSMAAIAPGENGEDETVKTPGTLVVSGYVTCPDINKTVTPDLKHPNSGKLFYIDLGNNNHRLGGSSLAHVYQQLGDTPPDVDDAAQLKRAIEALQICIANSWISAGHDRSDGGLITTLLEMAFAGNCGITVELESTATPIEALFSEELGLVIETAPEHEAQVLETFQKANVPISGIGQSTTDPTIQISVNGITVLNAPMTDLRDTWEATSFQLERRQTNLECVVQEESGLAKRSAPPYTLSFTPTPTPEAILEATEKPKVAIIREEGSNGDREMTSAFFAAGFEPWDVTMSDLLNGLVTLDAFRGVVFVGGFSYADVLDSAKGWGGVIRFNDNLWSQFNAFYNRSDTFSLGVCNGCQLMALLGWVPFPGLDDAIQPRFIHNASGRFESRFSTLQIQESPSIMLKDMAGSSLGVWVAHGEGQAFFPQADILDRVQTENLIPVSYVDDNNATTEAYPFNPNGSPNGIAGLCSPDGRHLAMMPHPERAFLKWQWGWMPSDWQHDLDASPWLQMFQNAYHWCQNT